MSHTNRAKETLLQFMQAMYSWEKKATRSLRNKADKEMLKDELAPIFDQFCTSKKTLRAREVSLSVRFPFDYKLETHPIVDEEHDGNQAYFYIKENRSGIETLYRFQMVFQKGKWWINKKEWLDDGKWINSFL
ncbi:NTF2 fold immunity protein [Streptococcus infantis]|uniref:NTF2 fold immunity protein n=1 Tax=Streptococcus TaxID=1301 RepID=UPI001CC056A5|nr:NTF2 fold immunity protein [Streptococcus infantis]MBZ2110834.1 RhsIA family immunity protein [Streptococcus infantis]MBZ2112790.1 RhsIA family immunity protein [Streptococcus infantis]MBZ2118340.1 RhsIA family immunity protein [Streptococcus infantis]